MITSLYVIILIILKVIKIIVKNNIVLFYRMEMNYIAFIFVLMTILQSIEGQESILAVRKNFFNQYMLGSVTSNKQLSGHNQKIKCGLPPRVGMKYLGLRRHCYPPVESKIKLFTPPKLPTKYYDTGDKISFSPSRITFYTNQDQSYFVEVTITLSDPIIVTEGSSSTDAVQIQFYTGERLLLGTNKDELSTFNKNLTLSWDATETPEQKTFYFYAPSQLTTPLNGCVETVVSAPNCEGYYSIADSLNFHVNISS